MGKRLVTIATFDQAAQAHLAKNALDEAGIQATLTDGQLVAMDWLLSNAIGGVKVQVWEEDAERAVEVLEHKFGEHGEGLGATVPPEDLAAQAEAATPDENEERPEPAPPTLDEPESPPVSGSREDYARRTAFTAMLGLLLPPVAGYALYLFFNAALGEGELSQRGKFNMYIGLFMALSGLAWLPFFLSWFLNP